MTLIDFKNKSGFTLTEILVAVGVFSVVFTVTIGGFVSAMKVQRQIQALIAANSNVSLAIEQMAREIRTAVEFRVSDVPGVCDTGLNRNCRLSFYNVKGKFVEYSINDSGVLIRSLEGSPSPISDDNVYVQYLKFYVLGDQCPNYNNLEHAPRVTIVFGVSPRSERGVSDIVTQMQTTIASRQGFACKDAVLNVTP